jgi:hypothetical protein
MQFGWGVQAHAVNVLSTGMEPSSSSTHQRTAVASAHSSLYPLHPSSEVGHAARCMSGGP